MDALTDPVQIICDAFPSALSEDVRFVWNHLLTHYPSDAADVIFRRDATIWQLLDGECITIPYRIYLADHGALFPVPLTADQQIVFHCILSRSHDGHVRERHIKELLDMDPPHWALPYIIKVCDEYVVEILELVYTHLSGTDTSAYQALCRLNLQQFLYSHARMVSYWNEFGRWDCYRYRNYIGKALFETCFGYTRSMEQFRKRADR